MSTLVYPPQRPLSVGEVLDLTFRIYRGTLAKCLLFAALGVIAGQLTNIYSLAKGRSLGGGWQNMLETFRGQAGDPTFWIIYLVGSALTLAFYAAVTLRQYRMATGREVGGELATALQRLPALIGALILTLGTALACFVPALLFAPPVRYVVLVLLLIPMSYVIVAMSCSYTALLVTPAGAVASYLRSWRLTSGSFWRLSVIYTVAIIVLMVLSGVLAIVGAFLAGILGRGDVVLVAAATGVFVVVLSAITTPFYTALALAVFGDLTARKEGTDLEQRISATA